MKTFSAYILPIIFLLFYVTDCYSEDIIIDEINLSGTLGPGSFITDHNLIINFSDTLTISPGTTIKFSENTSLNVYGCLLAIGNTNQGIVFTSTGPATTWVGINFPSGKFAYNPEDEVWKSKFRHCSFENVAGQGAIYFTSSLAVRAIDSISYCNFSNVDNAIHILFARQNNLIINNSSFSSIQNTAVIIGNTSAVDIQVLSNNINDLSDRFLYIYSNSSLNSLNINSNILNQLNLKKATIWIDNNLNLYSLYLKTNEFRNFTADASFPFEESIVVCKNLDNLNILQIQNNEVDSIFFNQELNDTINSFFYAEYSKTISLKANNVKHLRNLKHFFLLDNSETVVVESCKFDTIYCDISLFKIVSEKSCKVYSGIFNDIITNSGNGCFFFDNIGAMESIILNNNRFKLITADNGPCLNINSLSGTVDTLVLSNNTIEQNRIGFLSKNGGVAYMRLSSIGNFQTIDNTIKDCKVTNYGGVYYFDTGTVNDILVSNDSLRYIEATNNGGYISVKNTIYNDNLIINDLYVDSCFSFLGSGGIIYLVSQNDNTGEFQVQNCRFNYFHAGDAENQNDGGGLFVKGDYKKLIFSENRFVQNPGTDLFPIAKNGGILFFEHSGSILDSVIISNNVFSKTDSLIISGSGGCIYFSSAAAINFFSIERNDFNKFHSASNGGLGYFDLHGTCDTLNISDNNISGCLSDISGGGFFFNSTGSSVNRINLSNNTAGNVNQGITAGNHGGAFYFNLQGSCNTLDILNNTMSNCIANGSGGAIYFKSSGIGNLKVCGSANQFQSFDNCKAKNGTGGSILINSSSQSINNIDITYNSVQSAQGQTNSSKNGGFMCVKAGGSLMNHLNLSSNSIGDNTHGILAHANGGAFYFDLTGKCDSLNILNNSFTNCTADTSGGAVFYNSSGIGQLNISGIGSDPQTFMNCKATKGSGGSFFINSVSQSINTVDIKYNDIQSSMEDKNAGLNGGGMFIKSMGGDVTYIDILGNTIGNETNGIRANLNGGAVYIDFLGKCHQLEINDNIFKNCLATGGSGGAVYFKSNGISQLLIKGTVDQYQTFKNCKAQAGSGGSLFIDGLSKSLENIDIQFNEILSTENDDYATIDGGGMYFKSGNAAVNHVRLLENLVGNDNFGISAGGNGGAFYFDLQGKCDTVALLNNAIKDCKAHNSGGGIYFQSIGIDVLKVQGTEDILQEFKNCIAETGSGGAVFVNSLSQSIGSIAVNYNDFQSALQVNNAGQDGGGIYLKSAGSDVDEVSIMGNKAGNQANGLEAGGNGGAFYIELLGNCSKLNILSNYFSKCNADGSGGAIDFLTLGIDNLYIKGTEEDYQIFNNCKSSNYGGGIYLKSNSIDLADINFNKFAQSQAGNGGAISFSSNNINNLGITSTDFVNCNAASNGGSIHISGINNQVPAVQTYLVDHCTFENSVATTGNGGSLFYSGNVATFDCLQSSFIENACNNPGSGFGAAIYLDLQNDLRNTLNFSLDTIQSCSSASGGIYLSNFNYAGFDENLFIDNFAWETGAVLSINNFDTLMVSSTLFSQNTSKTSGGAIFADSGSGTNSLIKIDSSDFEFNASVTGGALALNNFNLANIEGNSFIQNTCSDIELAADASGGAIYSQHVDSLIVVDNTFLRNTSLAPDQDDLQSFGGSVAAYDNKKVVLDHNDFYFSEAMYGGAVYANNTVAGIATEIRNDNNIFFQNQGIYGGAIYTEMQDLDIFNATQNLFLNNQAANSGGAVDLRHMNMVNSTRNIFRKNINEGKGQGSSIGASAIFTLGVAKVHLYNTVFDYNSYTDYSGLEKAPTAWFKNHDTVYIENCTFMNQQQQDRAVIYKEGNSDPLFINNSIFIGNLNTETPITNDNALINYSFIEGVITNAIDTSHCFFSPAPVFMTDSYILNDSDTNFIDAGNPDPMYDDSIGYPIGKGQKTCDLGVSGGRYNIWDDEEQLEIPLLTTFTRPIVIERYNGQCGWFRIYFSLQQGDEFTDYNWYVNDKIFDTHTVNELIEYFPDNEFLAVTGIAKNENTGTILTGNNTVNTMNEITYGGSQIIFNGDVHECDDEIVVNNACPLAIEDVSVSLMDLKMPYFASYKYAWSFSGEIGILNELFNEKSYNSISFNLDLVQDTTAIRYITVEYSGWDTVCEDIPHLNISCKLNLRYPNMSGNLHMISVSPEETLLDPVNAYLELGLNITPYYCSGNSFYQIAEGSIDPTLGIVSITPSPSGIPVGIASIEYTGNSLRIYPEMTSFGKGDYIIAINNLCNSCGFPANESRTVNIKYVEINEFGQNAISIWPNPAQDKVFIDFNHQNEKVRVEIINSVGIVMHKEILPAGSHPELDVSDLTDGVYYIRLYTLSSQQIYYKKLIIE